MSRKIGQQFQTDIENSCKEQDVFFHNIKDVFLPPDVRRRVRLPKNKYDSIIFHKGYLFPLELKTTNKKSLSFSESVIKEHQIEGLIEASKYEDVIPGFLINFREQPENLTYFIPINRFTEYKHIAENQMEHTYKCRKGKKLNRASIPVDICQEIGIEVLSVQKRIHHRYFIIDLLDSVIADYNRGRN